MGDIHPIPGIFHRKDTPPDVADKPWTFTKATEDESGATNLQARIMSIPTDESSESAGVRAHEMLHVALSPYISESMDSATLAAEDGRVETLATQAGIKRPMPVTPAKVREILNDASPGNLPLLAIATTGAPTESIVRDWLAQHGHSDLIALMDWARAQYLAGKGADVVANRLRGIPNRYRRRGIPNRYRRQGAPSMPGPIPAHMAPPPLPPPAVRQPRKKSAKHNAPSMAIPVDGNAYKAPAQKPNSYDQTVTWAKMEVKTPSLPIAIPAARGKSANRKRSTDEGTVPRNLWRMPIDGKVFTIRRHRRQGTVVIDVSGSMPISQENVSRFVASAPAAVVAVYGGQMESPASLTIIANNGRMAKTIPAHLYNQIDGPALWWLSKQRTPRVWVSDGVINGEEGVDASAEMRAEVETTVRRARIMQVNPHKIEDWQSAVIKALH